jgi:hypothetical protein
MTFSEWRAQMLALTPEERRATIKADAERAKLTREIAKPTPARARTK